jgi:hypothetical protein
VSGACDICGQEGCNRITLAQDPHPKEQIVTSGHIVREDVIVKTSPGAGVKLAAAGTVISHERAAALGLITPRAAAVAEAPPAPAKPAGKRSAKQGENRQKPQGENR